MYGSYGGQAQVGGGFSKTVAKITKTSYFTNMAAGIDL